MAMPGVSPFFTWVRQMTRPVPLRLSKTHRMDQSSPENVGWLVEVSTPPSAGIPQRRRLFIVGAKDEIRAKNLLVQRMRVSPAEACTFLRPVTLAEAGFQPGEVRACASEAVDS
jgi:hypothetical protein